MEDKEYYSALQSSLQSYDAKLWLIPGLFFVVVGLVIDELDKYFYSYRNGIIFFLGWIFVGLILIYYNKAHLFFLLIQKEINELDKDQERLSLASMPKKELKERLKNLEKKDKNFKINWTQYKLAEFQVSSWTRGIIFSTFFVFFILSTLIIFKNLFLLCQL